MNSNKTDKEVEEALKDTVDEAIESLKLSLASIQDSVVSIITLNKLRAENDIPNELERKMSGTTKKLKAKMLDQIDACSTQIDICFTIHSTAMKLESEVLKQLHSIRDQLDGLLRL